MKIMNNDNQLSKDSKYIQQHLANERTFLAWIRTAITIVGLGFLSAGLVHQVQDVSRAGKTLATITGLGSVVFGGLIMAMATVDFFKKRKGINAETFRAPKSIIIAVFSCLVIVDVLLIVLAYFLYI